VSPAQARLEAGSSVFWTPRRTGRNRGGPKTEFQGIVSFVLFMALLSLIRRSSGLAVTPRLDPSLFRDPLRTGAPWSAALAHWCGTEPDGSGLAAHFRTCHQDRGAIAVHSTGGVHGLRITRGHLS